MKFIVGLGNPGAEYEKSRHNVGFMMVDRLVEELGLANQWQASHKFKAQIIKSGQLVFLKPQDFMNNSGRVVRPVLEFYDSDSLSDLIVVHDDLDISLGEFKLQLGKGPKVHNGLLDLDRHLGGSGYWHVRVGVDNRTAELRGISGADYVLANFRPDEVEKLRALSQTLIDQLKELIEKPV